MSQLKKKPKKDSQVPAAGPKGQVVQPVKKAVPIPKKASQISANWKLLSKNIIPKNPIRPRRPKKMEDGLNNDEEKGHGKPAHIPKEWCNKFGFLDYTHYGNLKHCKDEEIPAVFKKVTRAVAIDCEMVGVDVLKTDALARVSVVNQYGYCLLDTFVKPKLRVTDYRTEFSGVREEDLKNAPSLEEVMKKVADLIRGKILVGHALQNDMDVLYIQHPRFKLRDTARYFRGHGGRTPSLKSLAEKHLKAEIQSGEHSSIQDAQAAMKLYLINRKAWEKSLEQKRRH